MATLNIELPSTKYHFLKDDSIFQSVIIETIFDYIEKKEDVETKNKLSWNQYFRSLNSKIEERLWKL